MPGFSFTNQKDGSVTFNIKPNEVGSHEVAIKHNNESVQGSPFAFHVDELAADRKITAYGPGISHGVTGEPATFSVAGAGQGEFSVDIEGPTTCDVKYCDSKDGGTTCTYLPTSSGDYQIHVKVKGKDISGSPFTAKITSEGRRKTALSINSCCKTGLGLTEADVASLVATIKPPLGKEEPCRLTKREGTEEIGIVFSPKEKGDHKVTVTRDGLNVGMSPYTVNFKVDQIGNSSKVKCSGNGLKSGVARQDNELVVDVKNAGLGVLSVAMEGKNRCSLSHVDNNDGTFKVTHKPSEPGNYILQVKYADQHVPGSPYQVEVGGEKSGKQVEKLTSKRHVLPVAEVGRPSELCLKLPGTDPIEMEASLTAASGATELCEIMDLEDHHYSIRFTPPEKGVHVLAIKHKGVHIPGSPFMYTVGPLEDTGNHRVKAFGYGLIKGEAGMPCEFNVYTHEAGAGTLQIAVEGHSKAKIDFEERSIPGSVGTSFTVAEPGDYLVAIKWDDQHVPDSPFLVHVMPHQVDMRKVTVQGLRQKGLDVGKANTFNVMLNGAVGQITSYVTLPNGEDEDCQVTEVNRGEFVVRFVPKDHGAHYVNILFNGQDIKDSPFYMGVGRTDVDPGVVVASGDGLYKGQTGVKNKFKVVTAGAGTAILSVDIEGPSKAQISYNDKEDGYEFAYVPTAPGFYYITIKYAGPFHIAGSPFKAKIAGGGRATGLKEKASVSFETTPKSAAAGKKFATVDDCKSDANKVVCKGNGLKKAFLNKKCMFTVETRGAGENVVFVNIMGQDGPAPVDELLIKRTSRTQYTVNYTLKVKGKYLMSVKYGNDDVAGGPFELDCM